MKLPGRHRAVLAATVAFSAAGMTLAVIPAAQAAPAATAASAPVLIDCTPHGLVKPKTFIITCADANDSLTKLTWSHWGSTASGKGTEVINTCVPSCVAGHFKKYGAGVSLTRPRPRPHHAGAELLHPDDHHLHRQGAARLPPRPDDQALDQGLSQRCAWPRSGVPA